ncbi:MAG TPA: LLM class flavin-dependent oxidoreductase, partial [Ktedonobacterales bacterium]|nr:LLM class flavin-dependent oxidoreductase [Ktedonobacterales bacterium]
QAMGVSLADRGARTDEYLAAMIALWKESPSSFAGHFVSFDGMSEQPHPTQRPHPPIIIGGHSPSAYRRAIQVGNGWYGWTLDLEQTAQALAALHEAASRYERPPDLGELEISITPPGTVDVEMARRYAEIGVHRLVVKPPTMDGAAMDDLIRSVSATLLGHV